MRIDADAGPIGFRGASIAAAAKDPAPISWHAVNGWRGPGALAIAFGHLFVTLEFFTYETLVPITLLVDFFFVLSGLLIAQAYTEKLSRAAAIPEYIIRRFGRIWPVQAVTLMVLVGYELTKLVLQTYFGKHFTSPAFAADGINFVQAIWTNLLLVHSLGIHDRETWNFPSWSLSVEFVTYAIFAAFCLLRPRTRRIASLATIVFALAILMVVAPNHMRSTYDYGLFRCLAGFFAGSLCYDAVRSWQLPTWPLPTLVEILALALVGVWLSHSVDNYLAFAAPLVICLFIVAFLPARGLLSRILLTKPFQFLADLSFTIYMVHAIVILGLIVCLHVYERWTGTPLFVGATNPFASQTGLNPVIQVPHIGSAVARISIGIGYITVVLLSSYAAYRLIETPGRVFFGGLAKRAGHLVGGRRRAVSCASDPVEQAR